MTNNATPLEAIAETSSVFRLRAPNPGFMTGSGTNTYIIVQEGQALVIDPGPDIASHVDNIIAAAGSVSQIKMILLTHMHPDHSPAVHRLKSLVPATVYGRAPDPSDHHQDHSVSIDSQVMDNTVIRFGSLDIQCILTPGHTDNHVCFLLSQENLLFTGDHIMQGSTVVIIPPFGNMSDYLASLSKLKQYDIDAIAPGHGEVIDNAMDEVDRLVAHRLARENKTMRELTRIGKASLEALVVRVYDDVDVFLHEVASFSLLAHLIKLQGDGKITEKSGIWMVNKNR